MKSVMSMPISHLSVSKSDLRVPEDPRNCLLAVAARCPLDWRILLQTVKQLEVLITMPGHQFELPICLPCFHYGHMDEAHSMNKILVCPTLISC